MNIINRFTLQTLKKNKIRTAVTIVGIILSTALFTGVTSMVYSMQQYLIQMEVANAGNWEGQVRSLSREDAEKLERCGWVKDDTQVGMVGYVNTQGVMKEERPYLGIRSLEKNYSDFFPIQIVQGRMAEKSDELVLENALQDNGEMQWRVGDTVTLQVGERMLDGKAVRESSFSYFEGESLGNLQSKTYRIVGICERPSMETMSSPGYLAFTAGVQEVSFRDVLFTSESPRDMEKQIVKFLVRKAGRARKDVNVGEDYKVHDDLLQYRGQIANQDVMEIIYRKGTILLLIIMAVSVTLIYNAFSISVNERMRQFGMLKSIGATRRQIRRSVFFEAFCLCGIGIPAGVLGGLLGMGITLHFVGNMLQDLVNTADPLPFRLAVAPISIVTAVAVALVTVFLSAMIPAARAVRMPAIEALRESRDVRITRKSIRSRRWVYLLFGFEGMLASKNFRRNRRKYRLTVFSLAVSIILFVVVGCFNSQLSDSIHMMKRTSSADISLMLDAKTMCGVPLEKSRKKMGGVQFVEEASYSQWAAYAYLMLDREDVDEDYYTLQKEGQNANTSVQANKNKDKILVPVTLYFVDDTSYKGWLEKNGEDVSRFMDSDRLCPMIWDEVYGVLEDHTMVKCRVFKKNTVPKEILCINRVKGYEYIESYGDIDLDKKSFPFARDEGGEKMMSGSKAVTSLKLHSPEVVDMDSHKVPLGIGNIDPYSGGVTMTLPYSALEKKAGRVEMSEVTGFFFRAKNSEKACAGLEEYLKKNSGFLRRAVQNVMDLREVEEANRAILAMLDIFIYGFMILISLIVIANIFNTISTNIQLRRREFAMLRSVGMSSKGFDRMMNFECLLYGAKALMIGLPVSFLLCWLMTISLQQGWNASYIIPWDNVAVVIVCVFVIVFGSMLYAMRKIKRDNPIEALRSDNL